MSGTEKMRIVSGIEAVGWKVLSFCHQGQYNNLLLETPGGGQFVPEDMMVLESTDFQTKRIFKFRGKEFLMHSFLEQSLSNGTCSTTTFYSSFDLKRL